jgi:hypothetical protein
MQGTIYGGTDPLLSGNLELEHALPYNFPSRQYVQSTFIFRVIDLLSFYERNLQMIGGKILRADKSFKVIKFLFTASEVEGRSAGSGSTRAYESVYTVMNERCEIVSIHFVRSGDYEEMKRILQSLRQRYEIHGYDEVKLFYTDNCCHEYKMLTEALPLLATADRATSADGKDESRRINYPLLPLPDDWPRKMIDTYDQLALFTAKLQERIDQSADEEKVFIGLDVEWNSLTPEEREAQKPETLQLATTGGEIGVIRLESTFCNVIERKNCTSKGALRLVFKHPKVVLCGVPVEKDVNLLYKHCPEELFGDHLTTLPGKIYDPCTVARQYHMIESGRGTGTLQRLT